MNDKIKAFLVTHKYLLILTGLNTLMFGACILPVIITKQILPTDAYRDIAYAQHILNGNPVWTDPALKGEYIWYPPLNPLLFALLSKITSLDLYTLYAYSPVYILFFIPLVFFFFIARLFDKKTAFLAVLLIPVMPWVITHLYTRPIPSWHTFVVILLILTYFVKSYKKGFNYKNAAILGLALGLSFNHHTLSTLIVYGAVFLFLLITHFLYKEKYRWPHLLLILLLPIVCWSPYLLLNLFRPKLNLEPLHFIAAEINDPHFALYIPNQFTFVLTFILLVSGFIFSLQKIKQERPVLLLYLIIALTICGQLLGYLHVLAEKYAGLAGILGNIPFLIPHEFQWFFQFFSLPLLAYGIIRFFEIHGLVKKKRLFAMLLLVLFLLPPYMELPRNSTKLYDKMVWNKAVEPALSRWISRNTPVNAVCLTSNAGLSFFFIQPYTGRKVVAQFDGHTNFNVNNKQRIADMNTMLLGAGLGVFYELADKYAVDYAVITEPDLPPHRLAFFNENFPVLFTDSDFYFGKTVIYKIQARTR